MMANKKINTFLSSYNEEVFNHALKLREVILAKLPGISEQVDLPARMIAYCFGQKYAEMICTIIPSEKGLKLGFYKGNELPDPDGLLQGNGKISRYVEIKSEKEIKSAALKRLLAEGFKAYKERMAVKK